MLRLDRSFFDRHVVQVAQDLLGKELVFGEHRGLITETEAYRGPEDPASHAFKGLTPRTQVMFGPPGFSYVYFIYGMYHCLNFVAEPEGQASGVLIRGVRLLTPPYTHLNGPGKVCRHLGIVKAHSGLDITTHKDFYLQSAEPVRAFDLTPRIGIKKATDLLWRFVIKDEA